MPLIDYEVAGDYNKLLTVSLTSSNINPLKNRLVEKAAQIKQQSQLQPQKFATQKPKDDTMSALMAFSDRQ